MALKVPLLIKPTPSFHAKDNISGRMSPSITGCALQTRVSLSCARGRISNRNGVFRTVGPLFGVTAAGGTPMKAAVYTRYGPPDVVVQITDVEKPVPKDNEVFIKVRAASVNPLDGGLMKGRPYIARVMTGLRKPKITQLGVDVAGQVEAVGRNVTQFKPGDEVFGVCIRYPQASGVKVWVCQGAFAEYVCAPESALVMKPDSVTFEQAASAPVAAFTALQGLRDKGHIQPGQKVLVNGASGGVGTFAVQIAKSFRAEVTGVCSTRNVDLVRSIGADHVIDYMKEDFTKTDQRYDLIFDLVGNHSFSERRRILNPNEIGRAHV